MKALLIKELRENFKIGVVALVMFTLLVLGVGFSYSRFIHAMALGARSPQTEWNSLHPLASETFLLAVTSFCGLFGVLLGWLQIHNEKHRDLWAFLIHRPAPRTHLFWAKTIAGLTLYSLAAGVPLFSFLFWMSIPGNLAAPFEWAMAWPLAASFLLGMVWYFGGMLTRLREARWYASRALGLGVAVVATGTTVAFSQWWQMALALAGCGVLLAFVVWGAFHSHGYYEPQPVLGKMALTTSLTLGATVIVTFGAMLIVYLAPGLLVHEPWRQYVMLNDGIVYKQISRWNGRIELQGLNGNVIKGVNSWQDISARFCPTLHLTPKMNQPDRHGPLFTYWDATPDTIWFHWTRYGRLVGYNLATRRLLGNLGPSGFAFGRSQPGERFAIPAQYVPSMSRQMLHTATTLYEVNIQSRTVRPIFNTTTDDPIFAAGHALGAGPYVAVLTHHWLQLIGPDDRTLWRIPFEQPRPDYTDVRISSIDIKDGRYAVWVGPSHEADQRNPGKLPTHVTWLSASQDALDKKVLLPPLSSPNEGNALRDKFVSVVMPPVMILTFFLAADELVPWQLPAIGLAIALLIFVPLGAWRARRYSFSLPAQIAWAIFHLFSGLPGFLAFLAVHDWPARERCHNCNKLRAVNRQQCEHCASDFPPPSRDGTEIFEPLLVRQTTPEIK